MIAPVRPGESPIFNKKLGAKKLGAKNLATLPARRLRLRGSVV